MLPPDLLEPPGRRGGLRPPSPMPFCEVRFGATLELGRSGGFAGSERSEPGGGRQSLGQFRRTDTAADTPDRKPR